MSIYKITEALTEDVKGQSYMDVGIHENVELAEVVVETSKNGNPFLAFYFENERGERASKTEWEVNAAKPLTDMTPEERTAYITKVNNQMARITTIAKQFVPKEELLFEAADFLSMITMFKDKLAGKTKDVKLRIKIVYDYNDWATLPSYLKYAWIEKMDDVPTDKSKIKILSNVDKMTKDGQDSRKTESNPFADTASDAKSPEPSDEVPF